MPCVMCAYDPAEVFVELLFEHRRRFLCCEVVVCFELVDEESLPLEDFEEQRHRKVVQVFQDLHDFLVLLVEEVFLHVGEAPGERGLLLVPFSLADHHQVEVCDVGCLELVEDDRDVVVVDREELAFVRQLGQGVDRIDRLSLP